MNQSEIRSLEVWRYAGCLWSLHSFRSPVVLDSLRSLKSCRSLEVEPTLEPEILSLESACTPDSVVWIHSGVCSSDSLRSLKSRRSLEVELTLAPVVCIHSGVWIVWSFSGVCNHSGVCSLELLRGLEPRVTPEAVVWSLESFRVCSLASLRSLKSRRCLESAFIPEHRIWGHSGVWSLEPIGNMESGSLDVLRIL